MNELFVEFQGYLGLVHFDQKNMTNDKDCDCLLEKKPNFGA